MKLIQKPENGKWIWVDGYCTTQEFSSEAEARDAAAEEEQAQEAEGLEVGGLAGAGILQWVY